MKTMKQRHALGRPGVLLALVAVLCLGVGRDVPRLSLVLGSVEIGTGEPPVWRKAHGGELLAPGDAVRTGSGGRAEIALGAGTMRVYENSVLRLPSDGIDRRGVKEVEMDGGVSLFDILKRDKDEEDFKVRTPEAVVMVKGTRFSVDLNAGLAISVFRGLVGVHDLAQQLQHEVLVRPGFTAHEGAHGFDLKLEQRTDPWEAWAEQSPAAADDAADDHVLDAELSAAREAVFETMDPKMVFQIMHDNPELQQSMQTQLQSIEGMEALLQDHSMEEIMLGFESRMQETFGENFEGLESFEGNFEEAMFEEFSAYLTELGFEGDLDYSTFESFDPVLDDGSTAPELASNVVSIFEIIHFGSDFFVLQKSGSTDAWGLSDTGLHAWLHGNLDVSKLGQATAETSDTFEQALMDAVGADPGVASPDDVLNVLITLRAIELHQ